MSHFKPIPSIASLSLFSIQDICVDDFWVPVEYDFHLFLLEVYHWLVLPLGGVVKPLPPLGFLMEFCCHVVYWKGAWERLFCCHVVYWKGAWERAIQGTTTREVATGIMYKEWPLRKCQPARSTAWLPEHQKPAYKSRMYDTLPSYMPMCDLHSNNLSKKYSNNHGNFLQPSSCTFWLMALSVTSVASV